MSKTAVRSHRRSSRGGTSSPKLSPTARIRAYKHTLQTGERLRSIREKKGLTQGDVGNLLGVDQTYISELETGRRFWRADLVIRFAQKLGVNVRDLDNKLYYFEEYKGIVELAESVASKFDNLLSAIEDDQEQAKSLLENIGNALENLESYFAPHTSEDNPTDTNESTDTSQRSQRGSRSRRLSTTASSG